MTQGDNQDKRLTEVFDCVLSPESLAIPTGNAGFFKGLKKTSDCAHIALEERHVYRKNPKISDDRKNLCNHPKI